METSLKKFIYIAACLFAISGSSAFRAKPVEADVNVYLEGTHTKSNLAVYIYADIDTVSISSYGIKLTYNTAALSNPEAKKNEAVWYFGDGTTNYPYMDPETETPGEVVIVGGILDTNHPDTGVIGTRVLLGKVTFSRVGTDTNFNLGLAHGRTGDYENFVTTNGDLLDDIGLTFGSITVTKRSAALPAIMGLLFD